MNARINSPHWQPGPFVWVLVSAFGCLVAVRGMMQVAFGSEPWWVGFAFVGMDVAAFAFIEGIWLYAQREVPFVDGRIVVRRWIEVLLRSPGTDIPLDSRTRSVITMQNGRRLKIERDGAVVVSMQLVLWERDEVAELASTFGQHGAALATLGDQM